MIDLVTGNILEADSEMSEEVLGSKKEALTRARTPRKAKSRTEASLLRERVVDGNLADTERRQLGRRRDSFEQRRLPRAILSDEERDGDAHVERRQRADAWHGERERSRLIRGERSFQADVEKVGQATTSENSSFCGRRSSANSGAGTQFTEGGPSSKSSENGLPPRRPSTCNARSWRT
jgi:hypothetical protein